MGLDTNGERRDAPEHAGKENRLASIGELLQHFCCFRKQLPLTKIKA